MSIFEDNEALLDKIEQAEATVEKVKIDDREAVPQQEREAVASGLKEYLTRLVGNIRDAGDDVQQLGGAIVLADLIEVLERYQGVFRIPGLEESLAALKEMWEKAH